VSPESIGQTAFLGVAWPRDGKLTAVGAAGNTVGQNWTKTLPNETVWPKRRVGIGESKRKFRFKDWGKGQVNEDLLAFIRK